MLETLFSPTSNFPVLEANAKLYVLKYDQYSSDDRNTTTFTANNADYGGAVYVDDDTNSGACASDTKTECFFQVLPSQKLPAYMLLTGHEEFSA